MSAASTGCRSAPTSRASAISAGPRKNGPTGKERIIYGTYTIYDTSDCRKNVEKANALEPRDAALEAAASAYVEAVGKLEPLLKEADDYYTQENYKDDKMAKGRRCIRASSPRGMRSRAPTRRCAAASKPSTTGARVERLAEIEQKRRPQGALSCRGADDPGQARAARGGHREARHRRDHAGAERLRRHRQGDRTISGADGGARSARSSSATPSRSSPRQSN